MTARAAGLLLLAALAGPRPLPASAAPADPNHAPARTAPASPGPGGAAGPPLVITMPDTQPALPSGTIEMDPSQMPSTGNANQLEPNIDGGGAPVR